MHVQSDCWKILRWKGIHSNHPSAVLAHDVHKHDGCCTSENKKHMTHVRFGQCNLTVSHSGDCICYTCESEYVALARDRREQAYSLDEELMCGKQCDCNDTMHPACCKIPEYSYNNACCLTDGHTIIGAPNVLSKNHLCEPCRAHYIEKHFDALSAAGQFPCGPHAALTPRALVAIYSESYKTSVVESDPGYVAVSPEPWAEEIE